MVGFGFCFRFLRLRLRVRGWDTEDAIGGGIGAHGFEIGQFIRRLVNVSDVCV